MKTKGITIWERKAEFFVLGAVGVVLVVYLMGQLASPNIRSVGRDDVGPADWQDKFQSTARSIRDRQNSPEVPDNIERAVSKGEAASSVSLSDFQASLTGRAGPDDVLDLPGYRVLPEVASGDAVGAANARFVDPSLPPPTQPQVYQTFDLLAGEVVSDHEPLLGPRVGELADDITWLTVASRFDVAEALSRFKTAGPDGELPLRDRWHGNRIDLLDVRLERQRRTSEGWSTAELIDVLPDQLSFRDRLEQQDSLDAGDRDDMLGTVVDPYQRRRVYQPEFFATMGRRWMDPSSVEETQALEEVMLSEDQASEQSFERRQLRKYEKRRRDLLVVIARQQSSGAAGGGSGGGAGARGAAGSSSKEDEALQRLLERLAQIDAKLAELRTALGIDPEGSEASDEAADSVESADSEMDRADVIWVWGHDFNVDPGQEYRYRISVVVYNPLFARKLSLVEDQKHLAESLVKVVEASEWSRPFRVEPPIRVLASRAVPEGMGDKSGRLGYGEAVAEVWRFFDGQWWSRTFTVQPGDVLGRRELPSGAVAGPDATPLDPVDFTTEWFVVDVVGRPEASRSDTRNGRGARIVLQHVADDQVMVIDPVEDAIKRRPDEDAL